MRSGKRHLNFKKSGKRIRQGRTVLVLATTEAERIKRLLPYD